MDNIIRAKNIWKMRLEGFSTHDIAKTLSASPKNIENILEYTDAGYYGSIQKNMSYYDDILFYSKRIELEQEKLYSLDNSLLLKKKIFKNILTVTVVLLITFVLY